jgi:hypothetical protein
MVQPLSKVVIEIQYQGHKNQIRHLAAAAAAADGLCHSSF